MRSRRGVLLGRLGPNGRPLLLPPNEEIVELDETLDVQDHAAICAFYELDEVVPSPVLPWCRGVILDGVLVGQSVYALRQIGATITIGPTGGPFTMYSVVNVDPEVVELRHVPRSQPPASPTH